MFVQFAYSQSVEERLWIEEGNVFYLKKEFDKARASYAKSLIVNPASVKANYNMGNTFYELKKYDQAKTYYTKAAQASDSKEQKAKIFHNLGNVNMKEKKYDEAVKNYKEALRNNPSDNQTRYNFALAKKLLNKNQQEDKNKKEELPQPSDFAKQLKQQADKLAEEGAFLDALNLMREGLKKDPSVKHYQSFMQKLDEVVIIDTLTLK